MMYLLKPHSFYLEQFGELHPATQRQLGTKLEYLKKHPFRNKKIKGIPLNLFRIQFEDDHKQKRLIYLVDPPFVKLLFILNRSNDYKDLRKYLKKLGCL